MAESFLLKKFIVSIGIAFLFMTALSQNAHAKESSAIKLACLPEDERYNGCGIFLNGDAHHCPGNMPLIKGDGASKAWLNINGQTVEFLRTEIHGSPGKGQSWNEIFSASGYALRLDFSPAPDTCSNWKVETDEGCEFFDMKAKAVITDQKGHQKKLWLDGSSGC